MTCGRSSSGGRPPPAASRPTSWCSTAPASRPKGGAGVSPSRLGHGTTVEVVTDRRGVPLGAATGGAAVHEVNLAPAAPADLPPDLPVPRGVPVRADRAYDSDPLREQLDPDGFRRLARHRRNRTRPPVDDGRRLRRLQRRWVVERSFAWLEGFRRVGTRYERRCGLFDGFVSLACALVALNKLL